MLLQLALPTFFFRSTTPTIEQEYEKKTMLFQLALPTFFSRGVEMKTALFSYVIRISCHSCHTQRR
jgi:hypothetical protein